MIVVENYTSAMVSDLWQVYFTAIRNVCIKDYSEAQVKAWAPDLIDQNQLQQKFASLKPFVARIGSKIGGYGDLQPDGLIDHFFVHGDYQGRGVGAELMRAILAKGAAFERIFSHVSVTAKPFFLHYGFVVEKQQEIDIRDCRMPNNLMSRRQ